MPETSTTGVDDQTTADATTSTTSADSTATDNQTATSGDDLKDASQSTDTSADGDKTSTEGSDKVDTPASKFDSDIDDWAQNRGLPVPTNDSERLAYQSQRDERREFTRDQQAKKDADALSKTVAEAKPTDAQQQDDDIDPLERRQDALEQQLAEERITRQQSEFYSLKKVTPEEHKVLLDVMKEKFTRPTTEEGKKKAFEIWSSPDALPDLLDLAKARLSQGSTDTVAQEAAQKERELIARESQANSPGRGAKSSTSKQKTPEDERLERFSNWG